MFSEATEMPWLWAGLAAYALAAFYAFRGIAQERALASGAVVTRGHEGLVLLFMACGVLLLAVSLGVRWERIGHGPFVNLFELLTSQLFSLGLIYTLVYWRLPLLRPSAIVTLPIIWVLGLWVLMLEPKDVPFPPTYYNNWLWAHVGFGKVFLAFSMVGSGIAGVILLRWVGWFASWLSHLPPDEVLDRYAWRFMVLALVFDSLMLIAGAVWAQDAWGRFWQWDALETSAFLTWLALGGAIHARLAWNVPIRLGAVFILIIFVVAFMTYFSTPFISEAAHKGVI
jgi:ABC-type transport system involved in cytochrome c biogenesis permease subunit